MVVGRPDQIEGKDVPTAQGSVLQLRFLYLLHVWWDVRRRCYLRLVVHMLLESALKCWRPSELFVHDPPTVPVLVRLK